ncbi:MAG: hypothetical protein EA379_06445 [Phycisphaerales bacterium]|nr:MAG: hypothetical protein EA379_06445 [Phycisphaerales bacterium]
MRNRSFANSPRGGALAAGTILGAVCAAGAGAGPIVSSILASEDGDVHYTGLSNYAVNTTSAAVVSVRSGGNNVRNGVYVFDLGSIPSWAIVTGATLRLTTGALISNVGSTADVFFQAYASDGTITVDDHQNFLSAAQVAMETFTVGTSANTPLTIDFDDLAPLQAAIDDGASFLSVRSTTVNFVTFSIRSLESTVGVEFKPTLELTYIPSPGSAALMCLAIGVMAPRRRARRA